MADRYVTIHKTPTGPGDARPTAIQIIKDEQLEGKLVGKVALVTGCSSGFGVETARALFLTGATLYLTARDLTKARTALKDIADSDRVHFLHLELDSFDSVRSCAAEFLSSSSSLNILVLNAGIMACPPGRTKDGFETQFGTNHLGHFLLFNLLQPALLAGVTHDRASRVVFVSSIGHRLGSVQFDDINFENNYDPMVAYGQSKTANVWTANEVERRYGDQGIHAWSLQPGGAMTELGRHVEDPSIVEAVLADPWISKSIKTAEQGASTSIWAATAAALEGQGGKYLEDCQVIGPWDPATSKFSPGYAPHAYDTEKAKELWEKSIKWVGL